MGQFDSFLVVSQSQPENEALNAEREKLGPAYYDEPQRKPDELPIYLQFFGGLCLGVSFFCYGLHLLLTKDYCLYWLACVPLIGAGVYFPASAYGALLFGSWLIFWRLLGL